MLNELWFHLPRAPLVAGLVVAAVILVRRRPSRRAAVLAIAALCGLAGELLFGIVMHGRRIDPTPDGLRLHLLLMTAREAWRATCIVLLVCAVVADRRPTKPSGPEADYREPPAG